VSRQELTRVLGELVEHRYARRADGLQSISDALRRLGDGAPAAIIAGSAAALGASADFDLVLVSRLDGEALRPQALWKRDEAAELEPRTIPVRYPLVEAEVAHRHEAARASVQSGRAALAEMFEWADYVVADVAIESRTVGFVHAARGTNGVDDLDVDLVSYYAGGLARMFERAVLREQLNRQQAQLQAAARWIAGEMRRLSELTAPSTDRHADLAELLTARELDVVRLLARGESNRAIAAALLIGEGTVKYHVKNILRKLQARSRTDAVSRYMRLFGPAGGR
jgi:DNA-binding CsgD family transcriptional regulator